MTSGWLCCRDAEVVALRQHLKESEEKWLQQLMQARQTALDESMQRSTQQQSALERETEHVQRLQQQLDVLGASLAVKEAKLEAAHRQLGAVLDTTQKMEATHAQVCTQS
jgi:tRNA U34 5-carboxymethylaminomethyl modifying GTPase MnmE/TrmE